MGKNKDEKQKLEEAKPEGSETTSLEPEFAFDEISDLLLSQIYFLDDKIKSYFWVNFGLLLLIAVFSTALIVIGIVLAFQYGPANLKIIFSLSAILFGFVFLILIIRINPINKMILMIKRISQIKVILVGFMKQITYIEQTGKNKDSEEVSQLISFSKEIVQQTVDDLENPLD